MKLNIGSCCSVGMMGGARSHSPICAKRVPMNPPGYGLVCVCVYVCVCVCVCQVFGTVFLQRLKGSFNIGLTLQ